MNLHKEVEKRSGGHCELCGTSESLGTYAVAPKSGTNIDEIAYICENCKGQIDTSIALNVNHWRCLNDSMWSEVPAVQVLAYRMLNRLKGEGWLADLLDMMYLEDDILQWAKSGIEDETEKIVHRDSNGVELKQGDSVVIIKDLNVKGSSMVAKRGTAVRNINLVHDNEGQIEGKVDGQRIVILTKYVKK